MPAPILQPDYYPIAWTHTRYARNRVDITGVKKIVIVSLLAIAESALNFYYAAVNMGLFFKSLPNELKTRLDRLLPPLPAPVEIRPDPPEIVRHIQKKSTQESLMESRIALASIALLTTGMLLHSSLLIDLWDQVFPPEAYFFPN